METRPPSVSTVENRPGDALTAGRLDESGAGKDRISPAIYQKDTDDPH